MRKTRAEFGDFLSTSRFLFLMFVAVCVFVGAARAANYTVTNTLDAGAGSLRNAVAQANATTADDAITFSIPLSDANCTAGGVCTITLTSGALTVNGTVTSGKLTITNSTGAAKLLISGNNASRIFILVRTDFSGADLTVSGITITNGNNNSYPNNNNGGAIACETDSVLTLNGSTVTNSVSQQNAGGIYVVQATLNLNNSLVSGNSAGNNGGGIQTIAGTTNVLNSTIANNTSYLGGGLRAGGTLNLTNSTVSGNSVTGYVGAIYLDGTLNMTNSTVSANRDNGFSGGLYEDFNAAAFVRNSIIAGNTSSGSGPPDVYRASSATFTSLGNNLIGNSTNTGNSTTWQSSDILNQDPRLAPLADNGGATPTHALMTNSPAIDAGNDCVKNLSCPSNNPPVAITIDQRGAARSGRVDIGAFEVPTAPTAASVSIGGRVLVGGRGLAQARVTLTDMSGATRDALTDVSGYYRFNDVTAGETYILAVFHKRYTFVQPLQVLNISDDAMEFNFTGNSEKRVKVF